LPHFGHFEVHPPLGSLPSTPIDEVMNQQPPCPRPSGADGGRLGGIPIAMS